MEIGYVPFSINPSSQNVTFQNVATSLRLTQGRNQTFGIDKARSW